MGDHKLCVYCADLIYTHLMYSQKIENYKKMPKLTTVQREILVGTLLGDGHLETQNQGRTYRLKIEHALAQKAYVDWLYNQWHEWVITPPQIKYQTIQGKIYAKYWFNTVSHGSFRFYAQQFYRQRKKIVPRLVKHMLTPLGLAVWFMDDGSMKSKYHRALILNTQAFSLDDIRRLQDSLKDIFNLETKMRKQKEGTQIYIFAELSGRFKEIVAPYILPEMEYKLGTIDKVTQVPKM